MINHVESEQRVGYEEIQGQIVDRETFWSLRQKKPIPAKEISRQFPWTESQLAVYQRDLQVFLSQELTRKSCGEILRLQEEERNLEADFLLRLREHEGVQTDLVKRQEKLVERERGERRRIATETNDIRIIWDRLRVTVGQRQENPNRNLLEQILARAPRFPLSIHPLLLPFTQEGEQLQQAIEMTEQEKGNLKIGYEEKTTPLRNSKKQKKEDLTESFNDWVTESPERLITHLLQFPDEILLLRRQYHRKFGNDPQAQKGLEESLKKYGLLGETVKLKTSTITISTLSFPAETSESEAKPEPRWGFVFPNAARIIRGRRDIRDTLKVTLGRGCPDTLKNSILRAFLSLQSSPLNNPHIDTVGGAEVRGELGKYKLYLPEGWRAFFDFKQTGDGKNIIEIHAIMSHEEWDKKQR